jgi:hypothetical protein
MIRRRKKKPELEQVPLEDITRDADKRLKAARAEAAETARQWPVTEHVASIKKELADINGLAAAVANLIPPRHVPRHQSGD